MRVPGIAAIALLIFIASAQSFAQETGSITGIVTSANNAAVPGAIVTLWAVEDGTMAQAAVPNNPQYTSDLSTSLPGAYTFTGVPPGKYNVTAAWGQYWYYTEVDLMGGTATANIVIPEYIDVLNFSAPVPSPRTYYTYVPVRVSSPVPQATTARSPGFGAVPILIAIPLAMLLRKWLKCP
jgi:hypothetical protein